MRRSIATACALAMVGLAGCREVRLGYPFLGQMLRGAFRDYVRLDDARQRRLDRELDRYLGWHRSVMLPAYARFLRAEAERHRRGPLSAEDFAKSRAETDRLFARTFAPLAEIAARTLVDLPKKEVAELARRVAEEEAEFREEQLSRARRPLAERLESSFEVFERFVGDLTAEQRATLGEHLARSFPSPERWLAAREAKGKRLLALLEAGAPEAEVRAHLTVWWTGVGAPPDDPGREFVGNMYEALRLLFERLGPEQRARLVEVLTDYAEDFEALAAP